MTPRSASRWAGAVLLAALVAVGAVGPRPPVAAAPSEGFDGATIRLSDGSVPAGTWIGVEGRSFPPGGLVLVEVCGWHVQPALGCDDATAVPAPVDAAGAFATLLHVEEPLVPCPCTVRVRAQDERDGVASVPIVIEGVAVLDEPAGSDPAQDPLPADLRVTEVALDGNGPWTAWFGAPPSRTLRYTITNVGVTPVDEVVVRLRGPSEDGGGAPLDAPPVGSLDPGEAKSFELTVDLPAFATGEHRIEGAVEGGEEVRRFQATTSTFPWMLALIPALVVLEVVLLVARNLLRDRLEAREPEPELDLAPSVAASVAARVSSVQAAGFDAAPMARRVIGGAAAAQTAGSAELAEPPASEAR